MEEEAINELTLRDILVILQRRWWVVLALMAGGGVLASLVTLRMPRIYEGKSQIEVKAPTQSPSSLLTGLQGSGEDFKQTQLALFDNAAVADQIVADMKEEGYELTRLEVQRLVTAVDRRNTGLIDIAARSTNPKLAQALANRAASAFQTYQDSISLKSAQRDLDLMWKRVEKAKDAMDRSSRDLAVLQNRYGIINLPEQSKEQISRLSTVELAAEEARRNMEGADTRLAELRSQLARQNSILRNSGDRDNAQISQLRLRLSDLQARLTDLKQKYVQFPAATDPLEAQIRETERQLRNELSKVGEGELGLESQEKLMYELQSAERDSMALRTQYERLSSQLQQTTASFRDLPGKARAYALMSERADVDRELYTKTFESYQQIEMEKLAHPSVIEITQLADVPKVQVSPRPLRNLLLGIFLGLVLGLLSAFALEHLDEAVHSEAELRQLAPELPVLGVLPAVPNVDVFTSEDASTSASRGPYRLLWSNIGFSMLDEPIRTMVMTSTVMGEGKSLTLANIARSAAEEGKRVILVDCDLRRPSLHQKFGVPDSLGLCEVLAGKIRLDDALLETGQPNLLLLPAGKTLPLNPIVLLKSERLGQLMEELLQRADLVLFDAPPAVAITDALVLASRCQAVLQVVEAGKAKKEHIRKVIESVTRARARHIGLVLNKVRRGAFGQYGYYYYYQYQNYTNSSDSNGKENGKANGKANGKNKPRKKLETTSKK